MLWISHRGNVNGPEPSLENNPEFLDSAISQGFDVEVDLWASNQDLFLGHDEGQYMVTNSWLVERSTSLWVHCKNIGAASISESLGLNWFIHTTESHVFTRRGFIWCYPGQPGIGSKSIQVLAPVLGDPQTFAGFYGICSDFVEKHRQEILD